MRCEQCHIEMEIDDLKTHLATFRCPKCGSKSHATVSFPLPRMHRRLKVLIAWEGSSPSSTEVLKLRNLLPPLRNTSAQEVLDKAKEVKAWDCGEMEYGPAIDLSNKAKGLGLKVYVVDTEPQNR